MSDHPPPLKDYRPPARPRVFKPGEAIPPVTTIEEYERAERENIHCDEVTGCVFTKPDDAGQD